MEMAGIGEAASVIAVIQITGQVAALCGGYLSKVKSAQADIEHVLEKTLTLQNVLQKIGEILEGPKADQLLISTSVSAAMRSCLSDLKDVEAKLSPGERQKAMSRFGLRALKWPITGDRLKETLQLLERYTTIFSAALSADHLSVAGPISKFFGSSLIASPLFGLTTRSISSS